jgi:MoaA/NifB/PqqE/SkfB family radical SAM enzyme
MEYRYTNWVVKLREDSKPRTLVLELTTACNYSCIHCFRFAARDFKVTFMDEELYHKIVKEAMDIGVRRIVYTGWGEPTVHPRFMEFLEDAKKLGFEVVVNTNGSRLEELAVSFVKLGVDEVYVSIDAFDIKLYSSIRRFGDLSTVTRGLLTLRKVKTGISSLKPTVKAILTVTKVNIGEVSRVLNYAIDTGISEIVINNYIPYIGGDLGLDCLGDEDCSDPLPASPET